MSNKIVTGLALAAAIATVPVHAAPPIGGYLEAQTTVAGVIAKLNVGGRIYWNGRVQAGWDAIPACGGSQVAMNRLQSQSTATLYASRQYANAPAVQAIWSAAVFLRPSANLACLKRLVTRY